MHGYLNDFSAPPRNLKSLKLYGNLKKLPEWINSLQNLEKLVLSSWILEHDAAVQVLGRLPKLVSLRLWTKLFQGEDIRFRFHLHGSEEFPRLVVLELSDGLRSVEFEEGTMPRLECLHFCGNPDEANSGLFSGLEFLHSLKEFRLDNRTYKQEFMEDVQAQLSQLAGRTRSKAGGEVLKSQLIVPGHCFFLCCFLVTLLCV